MILSGIGTVSSKRHVAVEIYNLRYTGLHRLAARISGLSQKVTSLTATFGSPGAVAFYLHDDGWFELAEYVENETCPIGYIDTIDVTPRLQSRGYGSAMLKQTLEVLQRLGVCKVFLHMAPHPGWQEALKAFYMVHGFVLAGSVPTHPLGLALLVKVL